jgi:hypothetical protein
MDLKTYIDLFILLREDTSTVQERRAFGLKHETLKTDPLAQLQVWHDACVSRLKRPLTSERIDTLLYGVTVIVLIAAFVLGLFAGAALLSYNGKEPVNLVYFLAMVVFLPLVTIILTLIAMFKADRAKNLLVHLSPAFWFQKIVARFSTEAAADLESLHLNPLLANWIVIKRSQMAALAFSTGMLLALLGVVATKDVAFAWSTTLDITPEAFHRFTQILALPWRDWMPSAVPTLALVEQSHYFRLGGKVTAEMIGHASILGAWWKFLAMATLFYAIILRLGVYLLALRGVRRALERAVLSLDGVSRLLREMNEPLITTHETKEAGSDLLPGNEVAEVTDEMIDPAYDMIQGWSIDTDMLCVIAEYVGVTAPYYREAGGNNTLEEDSRLAKESRGGVLLFVKAWEPPTMDFIDYLGMLASSVEKITVCPVGTPQQNYRAAPKAVDVWVRKLASEAIEKTEVKRCL